MFSLIAGFSPFSIIMGPLRSMLKALITPLMDALSSLIMGILEPVFLEIVRLIALFGTLLLQIVVRLIMGILARIFAGSISQILFVASASPKMLENEFVIQAGGYMQTFAASLVVLVALYYGFKAFFAHLGFETEEPWKIMIRAGISLFLVMASLDICANVLKFLPVSVGMIFQAFGVGNASGADAKALSEFAEGLAIADFDPLTMPVHVIVFLMIIVKCFLLIARYAERYVQILILVIFSPIAFAFTVTKQSFKYFEGWFILFAGAMIIQIIQVAGFATLLAININPPQDFNIFGLGQALLSLGCLTIMEQANAISQAIGGMNFGVERSDGGVFKSTFDYGSYLAGRFSGALGRGVKK